MLGNLFLKSIDRVMNPPTDNIYIMVEGDVERLTGGKYGINPPVIVQRLRGAAVVRGGHFKLTREINGIKYKGLEEYQVPMDEIDALRLTPDDMPRLKIIHNNAIFRVVNYQSIWGMRTVRLWVEKTKDPYPSLYSAWTFEDDTVGEHPSGWDVYDPSNMVKVNSGDGYGNLGKYLEMSNYVDDEHIRAWVTASDHVGGPFLRIKWRNLWTNVIDTGGICGYDWAGDTEDVEDEDNIGLLLVHLADAASGGVNLINGLEEFIDVILYQDEWYTFDVTLDRVGNLLTISIYRESTSEYIVQKSVAYDPDIIEGIVDHPLDLSAATKMGFACHKLGGIYGRQGTRLVDDVEVWVVA